MALARVRVVKVFVNSGPLFRGTGVVRRWMGGVQREMTANSRRFAPTRTGALRAGIRGTVATTGARRVQGTTWSRAPHTPYVVYGTKSPIRSDIGFAHGIGEGRSWVFVPGRFGPMRRNVRFHWMRLRPGKGFPVLYRDQVRGQQANNFFYRAYVVTKGRHRSLPTRGPAVR